MCLASPIICRRSPHNDKIEYEKRLADARNTRTLFKSYRSLPSTLRFRSAEASTGLKKVELFAIFLLKTTSNLLNNK